MPDATITIPRDRFEAMVRQCLAMREQLDSLSLLMQAELRTASPTDPRTPKQEPPATFGRRSA